MTILQIKCFVSLAETRRLTETANLFNLQVSTLSKYIANIESSFSAKLFQKGPSGLSLTKEGELIYPGMKFITREFDELQLHMNKLTKTDSTTISIALAFHQAEILALLIGFSQIYPDINLSIQETPSSEIRSMLGTGNVDIAITYEELLMKRFYNTVPVRKDTLVAVVGRKHLLASKKCISIRELKDDIFFLFKGDILLYRFQVNTCISAGFTPTESPHDFRVDTVMEYVSKNRGVSLLINDVVKSLQNDEVVALPLNESPSLTLSIVLPVDNCPETHERLIKFIKTSSNTST